MDIHTYAWSIETQWLEWNKVQCTIHRGFDVEALEWPKWLRESELVTAWGPEHLVNLGSGITLWEKKLCKILLDWKSTKEMGAIFYSKVLVYRYVDFGGESHVLIIPFGCYQLMCKSLAETISGACSILGGWNYSYPCFPRHTVFFVCKISSCRHCPH